MELYSINIAFNLHRLSGQVVLWQSGGRQGGSTEICNLISSLLCYVSFSV